MMLALLCSLGVVLIIRMVWDKRTRFVKILYLRKLLGVSFMHRAWKALIVHDSSSEAVVTMSVPIVVSCVSCIDEVEASVSNVGLGCCVLNEKKEVFK